MSECLVSKRGIVAGSFAVAAVLHVLAGFVITDFPAWSMFSRSDRYTYTLVDKDIVPLDIRSVVPMRAYTVCDHRTVFAISRWLARHDPAGMPYTGQLVRWRGLDDSSEKDVFHFRIVMGQQMDPVLRILQFR